MILSGQDFPLERLQQQPDIRHPLELARTLDGGIPISPAVIVGEGEMVYHQMLRKVFDQISTGKETFSLGWPEWVFTILLPIGSIFLVLHAIEYLVDVMSNKAACVKPAETEGGKETV